MFLSDIVLSFHFVFRNFERLGLDFLRKVKPMLSDLNTYLSKVGQNNNAVILQILQRFYHLSYEALLEAGQVQVQFIPVI